MKKLTLSLLLMSLFGLLNAQEINKEIGILSTDNFFQICEKADHFFNETSAGPVMSRPNTPAFYDDEYTEYQRWKWYWHTRVDENGNFPDITAARNEVLRNGNPAVTTASWTNISQTTALSGYEGMGRATCVAFHPTDPNTIYVGAPIGGLWKTTNAGASWTPLTDGLPYVSVGSCIVDPVNPNNIYISVGDHIGWWNNSLGIYKSTDGGVTWNPSGLSWTLSQGNAIAKIEMDPYNNQVIYACTTAGLYKTSDAGVTWNIVQTGDHSDLEFEPGTSNIYTAKYDYWGSSEVYRSIDGGSSWNAITSFGMQYNYIRIAVTPANPAKIAMLCSTTNHPLYMSSDWGNTVNYVSDVAENSILFISPTDETIMYTGGVYIQKSTNSGQTFNTITWWYYNFPYADVHADQHNVFFDPLDMDKIYFCNDGGVYHYSESTDNWGDISNGLIITQFYKIAASAADPMMIIGGTQDNGGRMRESNGSWRATNGGDAMEVAVDPTDDNIIYTTYINGQIYRSLDKWTNDTYYDISANIPGGQPNGSWVTPYMLDPSDNNSIVAGYDDVWRSTNQGGNWTQLSTNIANGNTLECLEVAPSDFNTIYCSAGSTLYKTSDLGATWTTHNAGGSPSITSIVVNPTNPNQVWITRGGYTSIYKVQMSLDGGSTWTNLSSGLPNVSVNTSLYENGSANLIYIGTDAGIYYRDTITNAWTNYSNGLPNTSVTDLQIFYPTRKLRAGTYGRGIWEIDLVNPLGIENQNTSDAGILKIYPNPSSGIFNLNYTSNLKSPVTISVKNILGETLLTLENTTTTQLDLSTFPKGFYFLTLTQMGNQQTQILIVK
ncbi:hypothetical protein BH09BAC5_BH09BAC5_02040 [soil metagenome]